MPSATTASPAGSHWGIRVHPHSRNVHLHVVAEGSQSLRCAPIPGRELVGHGPTYQFSICADSHAFELPFRIGNSLPKSLRQSIVRASIQDTCDRSEEHTYDI